MREISKADDIREEYVNNNKIGITPIRRLLEKIYVRWRRGKIEEKVEDYLIKNLKSSTKRQSYIEKIEAFRLQGEATHEVPLHVPLESSAAAHDMPSTSSCHLMCHKCHNRKPPVGVLEQYGISRLFKNRTVSAETD
ncbi:hypothetical protein MTP99_000100 [Tenebrio molitor]|nr:hypothetical protein MTP99_000100 [Tenebrio molitor]